MSDTHGDDSPIQIIDLRENFFRISNNIFSADLDAYAIATYCAIARHSDYETSKAWPSISRICEYIGASRPTVCKAIADLEEKNIIKAYKKAGGSTIYYLLSIPSKQGLPVNDVYRTSKPRLLPSKPRLPVPVNDVYSNDTHVTKQKNETQDNENVPSQDSTPKTGAPQIICIGGFWTITESHYNQLHDLYTVDIIAELRKAAMWVEANPHRRKTPKGMPRFINSWIERAQNSNRAPATQKPSTGNIHLNVGF